MTTPQEPGGPSEPQRAAEEPRGTAGAGVKPRPGHARPAVDRLPPWRVLLHNEDISPMEYVVRTLVELTPLNPARAQSVMMEAHTTGVALVLVTHRERAELYRDQFRSKSLTVTIEPADQ